MRISVIDGRHLTTAESARWSAIQRNQPSLGSPFLSPEFVAAVAAVRTGVRVAVIEDGNRIVGFFPYQQIAPFVAETVGGKHSDCQAVIAASDVPWSARQLLKGAQLHAWRFRRVLESQFQFSLYHAEFYRSPLVDLSLGFDTYAAAMRRAGNRSLVKLATMKRKFEEAEGPLSFELHSPQPEMLHALFECKSEQYQRTGQPDHFQIPWVVSLLERLHAIGTPNFAGMLSILRARGRVVAAHFGLRSATHWSYWFPCYNRAFAHFSPGLVLLTEMLRSAPALGLHTIELGPGEASYKNRFANGQRMLARGIAMADGFESFEAIAG